MPNGTTIKVFAPRIHKCNARVVREDAADMLQYYRDRLMILAASAPHNVDEGEGPLPWDFYVRREIDEILEGISDAYFQRLCADTSVELPEDCDDELEDIR